MPQKPKKLKIVYVLPGVTIGGTENMLLRVLSRFPASQYHIWIYSFKRERLLGEEFKKLGYPVVYANLPSRPVSITALVAFFKLALFLRRVKPEIIHSFLFSANIISRLAARVVGVQIVISSIRTEETLFELWLEAVTQRLVSKFIFVSQSLKEYTLKRCHILPSKTTVLYNGVNLEEKPSDEEVEKLRCSLKLSKAARIIGSIGRFEKEKGYEILIKAFKILHQEMPNLHLIIVGNGSLRKHLENLVKKLGIKNKVIFPGLRKDVWRWHLLFDVFVLPSICEGMPNVLLEAMSCQKPVVASSLPVIQEIIRNTQAAILVKPQDFHSFAKACKELLRDSSFAYQTAAQAKAVIQERFRLEECIEKLIKIYSLLAKKEFIFSPQGNKKISPLDKIVNSGHNLKRRSTSS